MRSERRKVFSFTSSIIIFGFIITVAIGSGLFIYFYTGDKSENPKNQKNDVKKVSKPVFKSFEEIYPKEYRKFKGQFDDIINLYKKYGKKEKKHPVSLASSATNSCFFNSFLRIFMNDENRCDSIMKTKFNPQTQKMSTLIKELLCSINSVVKAFEKTRLTCRIDTANFQNDIDKKITERIQQHQNGAQNDAVEYLTKINEIIAEEKGVMETGQSQIKELGEDKNCFKTDSRIFIFLEKNYNLLEESLNEFFQNNTNDPENINPDLQEKEENKIIKSEEMQELYDIEIIKNFASENTVKNIFIYPIIIINNQQYILHSALIYKGFISQGHYYTYIFKDGKYYLCNDDIVSEIRDITKMFKDIVRYCNFLVYKKSPKIEQEPEPEPQTTPVQ